MGFDLHAAAAAAYLVAAVAATLGLAQRAPRALRAAMLLLALGAVLHTLAFLTLHRYEPPPPLTSLPLAVSLAAWMGTLFFLLASRFARVRALVALVAPAAFLGAFFASISLARAAPTPAVASPAWSHLHVLLASGGIALLGVAGGAGALYVAHHRRIKRKRAGATRLPLPPLEALDRVNVVALSVGFLLLTLGMVSGVLWVYASEGRLWPGSAHAAATAFAWGIYAVLVTARFAAGQGARRSALCAVAGFAVLLIAVVGVGMLP